MAFYPCRKAALVDAIEQSAGAAAPIVTFNSQINGIPLAEFIANITPVQATGTPTPINPLPITGWSAVNVARTGKNLINPALKKIRGKNIYWNDSTDQISGITAKLAAGTYTVKVAMRTGVNCSLYLRKFETNTNISGFPVYNGTVGTFTLSETTNVCFWVYHNDITSIDDVVNVQLELGNTATTYAPYTGQTATINLGGTYYGGTLNVGTGVLTVTHGIVDLGTLEWQYSATYKWFNPTNASFPAANVKSVPNNVVADIKCTIYEPTTRNDIANDLTLNEKCCVNNGGYFIVRDLDYDDTNLFKSAMNGVKLVYELATPQTYQLTPAQLTQLLGENNVWADSGDSSIKYYKLQRR